MAAESILGGISQEQTLSQLTEAMKLLAKAIRHADYVNNLGNVKVDLTANTLGSLSVSMGSTSLSGNSGNIGTTIGAGATDQTFVSHNIARDGYRQFINKFI